MAKKNPITDAELQIMEVLWDSAEPLSAYEIRQRLNEKNQWERTTVLTLIRRLVEKEFISQEKKEVYYYSAVLEKGPYLKEETKQFIDRLYRGSSKDLIATLFQDKSLTEEDVRELRGYFNSIKKL